MLKKIDLANLKSDVGELDFNKLKNALTNLSNLKSKVDKLDVDKLVLVPADLSKLSDLVKNDVVKKDVYNAKIYDIEDKIPNITNLATDATLNAKINEVKNEIHNITNLATTAALTAIENKIPTHSKYITIPEFNKLIAENFAARLAQANLAGKNDIANFVKKTYFHNKLKNLNKKITSNKTKHALVENQLNELSKKLL